MRAMAGGPFPRQLSGPVVTLTVTGIAAAESEFPSGQEPSCTRRGPSPPRPGARRRCRSTTYGCGTGRPTSAGWSRPSQASTRPM
jgi:hypothetical protein